MGLDQDRIRSVNAALTEAARLDLASRSKSSRVKEGYLRDMEHKRAFDRARYRRKYAADPAFRKRERTRVRDWKLLTVKGATRNDRARMTQEESNALLQEMEAVLGGKDFR